MPLPPVRWQLPATPMLLLPESRPMPLPAWTPLQWPTKPAQQQPFLPEPLPQPVAPVPMQRQTVRVPVHWPQPPPAQSSTVPRLLPAWQR